MTAVASDLVLLEEHFCFDGWVRRFSHQSSSTSSEMKFHVFLPAASAGSKVPVLIWLSGLTCTDENFFQKSGAMQYLAQHNIALIAPDTSPRNVVEDEGKHGWDFGAGAGFYVNATEAPWSKNYHMYDYIASELPRLLAANFPVDTDRMGIFGHSMGGHGALTIALKNPSKFKSVSAFAPICHPCNCPWGQKAFTGYLGPDSEKWKEYDATELATRYHGRSLKILIDQGIGDKFLSGAVNQLLPQDFCHAAAQAGRQEDGEPRLQVAFQSHPNYDHSFFFITTFIEAHIRYHAQFL
eukprot:gnl/Hemi2/1556_TR557_c0_g1_i1.p1 gnl/Hemi2/1556_TR557_c0_g1~~gnl/Hemi2/1556_TR557_c0_g1_i1.p1  ORF type:complete len:296 (-),score=24.24 gnl/Hemi2/1556_TR557_c0_g1_i1:67-954(-)